MQNADGRLSTKCRLRRKTVFFFLANIITYGLSYNRCSKAIFHGNSGNIFLFLKWAKNIIYIQVEIPTLLQVMQSRKRRLTDKTIKYRLNRNLLKIPAISQAA